MRVSDLADLVVWLPAGCALWLSVGGPAALSDVRREARMIEFRLRELLWLQAGGKKAGRHPQPPEEPAFAHEKAVDESVEARKAAAHMRRQARIQ